LNAFFSTKPARAWIDLCQSIGIAAAPINAIDQVFTDPQVEARGLKIAMPHGAVGGRNVDLIGSPIKMSATPVSYRLPPPSLGEHTDEVLRQFLGLGDADIAGLHARGVI